KRGAHLSLSLERLDALQPEEKPIQRIGLSATQRPVERVMHFLIGNRGQETGDRAERFAARKPNPPTPFPTREGGELRGCPPGSALEDSARSVPRCAPPSLLEKGVGGLGL